MQDGAYYALYSSYDRLNSETDYSAWADFFCAAFEKFGAKKISSVLDLGCGTGAMTFELRQRGFDMTAVDISCDMLSVARQRAAETGYEDILWLCQDMRSFELYGTVDAAVCCLDGEFTLKRIEITPDRRLLLMPSNRNYQPIEVTEDNEFMVWGIVVYTIKANRRRRKI